MSSPEPVWRRIARRPAHLRGDPPRWSDIDPAMAGHIVVNRARLTAQRTVARIAALVDRIEDRERERRQP